MASWSACTARLSETHRQSLVVNVSADVELMVSPMYLAA